MIINRSSAEYSSFPRRHFKPSALRVGMWEDEKSLKKKINVIKPQIKTEANAALLFYALIFWKTALGSEECSRLVSQANSGPF